MYGGLILANNIGYNYGIAKLLISAIVFMTFGGIGGTLTPRTVFVTLSLIIFLRRTIVLYNLCLIYLYEASVAVTRIQVC